MKALVIAILLLISVNALAVTGASIVFTDTITPSSYEKARDKQAYIVIGEYVVSKDITYYQNQSYPNGGVMMVRFDSKAPSNIATQIETKLKVIFTGTNTNVRVSAY